MASRYAGFPANLEVPKFTSPFKQCMCRVCGETRRGTDTERKTFLYRSARSTQKLLVMSSVAQNQKAVQWVISFLIFGDERKEEATEETGSRQHQAYHRFLQNGFILAQIIGVVVVFVCVCVWPCACIDKSPYYASATVFEFHHYGETGVPGVVLFAAVSFGS